MSALGPAGGATDASGVALGAAVADGAALATGRPLGAGVAGGAPTYVLLMVRCVPVVVPLNVTLGSVVVKLLDGPKSVIVIGGGGAIVDDAPGETLGSGTTIVSCSGLESRCVTGSVAMMVKLLRPRANGTWRDQLPVSSAVVLYGVPSGPVMLSSAPLPAVPWIVTCCASIVETTLAG